MRTLVIRGTGFVGRYTVAELLDRGYDVAAVSRDRHGSAFDPGRDAEERLLDVLVG